MPVNVAVGEPQSRVVGEESYGDIVIGAGAKANDVAHDGVDKDVYRYWRYGSRGMHASRCCLNMRKDNCHDADT